MSYHYYLLYASILVWIFPIFRQYNSDYFIFFLSLGLADLVNTMLRSVGIVHANLLLIIFLYISYLGVLPKEKVKKMKMVYFFLLFAISLSNYLLDDKYFEVFTLMIISFAILFQVFEDFYSDILKCQEINMFYVIFILNMIIMLLKLFNMLTLTMGGIYYFIITMAFQILIGIFFSFYRPDKPKLVIPLNFRST